MSTIQAVLRGLFLATLCLVAGCENTVDPLVGWKWVAPVGYKVGEMRAVIDTIPGYKAISDNVQDFVNKLPISYSKYGNRRYCYWIADVTMYEDGTGRHAVKIEIPLDGTRHNYVLVYDKSNVRMKVIRFSSGHFSS